MNSDEQNNLKEKIWHKFNEDRLRMPDALNEEKINATSIDDISFGTKPSTRKNLFKNRDDIIKSLDIQFEEGISDDKTN